MSSHFFAAIFQKCKTNKMRRGTILSTGFVNYFAALILLRKNDFEMKQNLCKNLFYINEKQSLLLKDLKGAFATIVLTNKSCPLGQW